MASFKWTLAKLTVRVSANQYMRNSHLRSGHLSSLPQGPVVQSLIKPNPTLA